MMTLAAHRHRPREAAPHRFARNFGMYSEQLLAQLVKRGVEIAYVSYTTRALPSRRFSLRTIFAQRGGAERGNSSHPARPCR